MKNELQKQIVERKAILDDIKNKDKEHDKVVTSMVNKYKDEQTHKILEEKDKVKKYKEQLEQQLYDKSKFKVPSMDEKERLMNKIDEITQKR